MPAKSRKQQRALFAKKGAAWVKAHHFDKLKRGGGKKSK
jgi:hypothetical protein